MAFDRYNSRELQRACENFPLNGFIFNGPVHLESIIENPQDTYLGSPHGENYEPSIEEQERIRKSWMNSNKQY